MLIRGTPITIDEWWWVRPAEAALTAAAALCGGAAIMVRRGPSRRSWVMFLGAAAVALLVGVSLWHVVWAVRSAYL